MGAEAEGRIKREGTYVYLRLIHADVWHKPSQHGKLFSNEKYKFSKRKIKSSHACQRYKHILEDRFPSPNIPREIVS